MTAKFSLRVKLKKYITEANAKVLLNAEFFAKDLFILKLLTI